MLLVATTPAAAQGVTLQELEGSQLAITITRDMVVRRDGRQASVGANIDWSVRVGADGVIEESFQTTADTPYGRRRGERMSGSFTIDQVRRAEGLGGGEAVWTFKDETLSLIRSLKSGAYRLDIVVSRGAGGLACAAREAFARENGTGSIVLNSSLDGRPMTVVRSRQISSSCRLSRAKSRV
jgi:hypothetical protein